MEIHPFSVKHLSVQQVTDMYKAALRQLETRILEARINCLLDPDDESSVKLYEKLYRGLPALEAEYEEWVSSNSSAD